MGILTRYILYPTEMTVPSMFQGLYFQMWESSKLWKLSPLEVFLENIYALSWKRGTRLNSHLSPKRAFSAYPTHLAQMLFFSSMVRPTSSLHLFQRHEQHICQNTMGMLRQVRELQIEYEYRVLVTTKGRHRLPTMLCAKIAA